MAAHPEGIWTNPDLRLYHGTVDRHVPDLLLGVDLVRCRQRTDFGRGFYTTTFADQAWDWAGDVALRFPGARPTVVEFAVSREALAELHTLWFVRGGADADDFWNFVASCRTGGDHGSKLGGWYDVVIGPVAVRWERRRQLPDSDQVSFHTARAVAVLHAGRVRIAR